MIRGRTAAAIFSILLLSACGPRPTEIKSNVAPDLAFHPKAILVVQTASGILGTGSEKGFEDAFKQSAAACSVSASFFVKDPLALNPQTTTEDGTNLHNVHVDSVLTLRWLDLKRNGYGQLLSVDYGLTMTQMATKKPIWKAQITFARGNVFTTNADAGAALANSVFSAMVRDQVVQGCTAPQPQH